MTTAIPVIVPVKSLHDAKQRLSPVLSAEDRRNLVLAMLADVFSTLSDVETISRVLVVTPDQEVAALASAEGVSVLSEFYSGGLNAAVQRGLDHPDVRRVGKALIVPGDVPLATVAEIATLIAAGTRRDNPRVTIVPSRDGGGTNALLLSPMDVIQPEYGPDSFVKHLAAAVARRIDAEVMQLPGLARDIDLPDDLMELQRRRSGSSRYAFLRSIPKLDETRMGNLP